MVETRLERPTARRLEHRRLRGHHDTMDLELDTLTFDDEI